jgi:hypothetical protein
MRAAADHCKLLGLLGILKATGTVIPGNPGNDEKQ